MKMPAPTWTAAYSASRRKHAHRCLACNRIVAEGEAVVMARVSGGGTKAAHEACAEREHAGGLTVRQALEQWGLEYLAATGYREARARLGHTTR